MKKSKLSEIELPKSKSEFRIRHWELRDANCVQSASVDRYIPTVTSIEANCNVDQAKDWIIRQLQKVSAQSDLPLCIATSSDDEAMGMIGLFGLKENADVARCGYWISPKCRGKNFSGKALSLVSEWAFTALGLQKLELFIEPENTASVRVAEFAGYNFERLQLSESEIQGSHCEMKVFSRMAS